MVSLTFSSGWRSESTAFFVFQIPLSDSEFTESIIRLAPARSFREGFEDCSIRWEIGANSAMVASVVVNCVKAQFNSFYNFSIVLFISLNTSTRGTEKLVACDFGRDSGPPVRLILSLTAFTFGVVVNTTQDGKIGM